MPARTTRDLARSKFWNVQRQQRNSRAVNMPTCGSDSLWICIPYRKWLEEEHFTTVVGIRTTLKARVPQPSHSSSKAQRVKEQQAREPSHQASSARSRQDTVPGDSESKARARRDWWRSVRERTDSEWMAPSPEGWAHTVRARRERRWTVAEWPATSPMDSAQPDSEWAARRCSARARLGLVWIDRTLGRTGTGWARTAEAQRPDVETVAEMCGVLRNFQHWDTLSDKNCLNGTLLAFHCGTIWRWVRFLAQLVWKFG